ncbi:hypothetical protein IJ765_00360 [Candidatus Saccharibacteria bacterium]|nr:hypothetical protein [Candidatus Saccharibacteria bacterium]
MHRYAKKYSKNICNEILPTFIRNHIDHPETSGQYTETELQASIDFMMDLIKKLCKASRGTD